jgi:hypothetical protein
VKNAEKILVITNQFVFSGQQGDFEVDMAIIFLNICTQLTYHLLMDSDVSDFM